MLSDDISLGAFCAEVASNDCLHTMRGLETDIYAWGHKPGVAEWMSNEDIWCVGFWGHVLCAFGFRCRMCGNEVPVFNTCWWGNHRRLLCWHCHHQANYIKNRNKLADFDIALSMLAIKFIDGKKKSLPNPRSTPDFEFSENLLFTFIKTRPPMYRGHQELFDRLKYNFSIEWEADELEEFLSWQEDDNIPLIKAEFCPIFGRLKNMGDGVWYAPRSGKWLLFDGAKYIDSFKTATHAELPALFDQRSGERDK